MEADIDGAHFAIHVRMVRVVELILSRRARVFVQWIAVANFVFCCSLLIFLHLNYVGKAECLPKLLANQTDDYHILQIKISSLWTKFSEELKTTSDMPQISPLFLSSRSSPINLGDLLYRSLSLNTYDIVSQFASATMSGSEGEESEDETDSDSDATSYPSSPTSETPSDNPSTPDTETKDAPQETPDTPQETKFDPVGITDTPADAPTQTAQSSTPGNPYPSLPPGTPQTPNKNNKNNKKPKKPVHWADLMIDELALWQDPVYVYSREKGYLYLSAKRKEEHGVKTLNITLDSDDPCLFPGHLLLEAFVGYDTVVLNNIVGTLGGRGYAYNKQTYELWSLNYIVHEAGTIRLDDYILWKLEVAFRSIMLFIVSATLVSFCMKHIQIHIFQFTMQMRHQSLQRSSFLPVIVAHLLESSVLILVMVGVLLCVSEFMTDKTISLLVLFLMWFTELFSLLAIRTHVSMKYFPRFVMCCFLLFYLYIFSYPLGFHYIAYLCLSFSIEVLIVYFYLQHEMPAIQNGSINYSRTRAVPLYSRPIFMLVRGVPPLQPHNVPPPVNPPPPPPPPPPANPHPPDLPPLVPAAHPHSE